MDFFTTGRSMESTTEWIQQRQPTGFRYDSACSNTELCAWHVASQEQPLVAKHIGGTIRAQNDRSRNRRTNEVPFIAGCNHFTRKNTRFRAPASSPKHSPCNIHEAMTMRFAASRSKPATIYARGNIKGRQWSSHSIAICNQRFKNRMELRTQEQPLVAKHIGGAIRAQNDRSRNRRTDEVPFIAGCNHFTRKKTQGFVLRLPPQNIAHATFMQPWQCVSQHPVANLLLSTHVATSKDDNEAAIKKTAKHVGFAVCL